MIDVEETYERFCDRSLPYEAWTHEAHLAVCWSDLQRRSARSSLEFLRRAIPAYNEAVGVVNSDSSGYHHTLTAYCVAAVASLSATSFDEIASASIVDRAAPLRSWSSARLFSPEARRGWLEPDLEALPFEAPPTQ